MLFCVLESRTPKSSQVGLEIYQFIVNNSTEKKFIAAFLSFSLNCPGEKTTPDHYNYFSHFLKLREGNKLCHLQVLSEGEVFFQELDYMPMKLAPY
jgi:hypothetical protein